MDVTLTCGEDQAIWEYAHTKKIPWATREYTETLAARRLEKRFTRILKEAKAITVSDECTLEAKFREQADKWDRETQHLSSPAQIMAHPSYQAILGMGREAVPFLLKDMKQNGREWFAALSYITGENPIKRKDAGKLDRMINAWLAWGKERGFL